MIAIGYSFNQKELGKRIRDERLKNKLTIEKLCELLDVSPSFIGLVERGTSGISIEKLCRLSEIFQVSTDYLIKGTQDNTLSASKVENHALDALNAYLYNSTEDEILFILSLIKFIKPRVDIKKT
ncbi:helix-turn-helix transcriptional regulator [Lachnospiraceae bacterium 46-61]